jgi:hypothetical protein
LIKGANRVKLRLRSRYLERYRKMFLKSKQTKEE